jgi:hypothetical protein
MAPSNQLGFECHPLPAEIVAKRFPSEADKLPCARLRRKFEDSGLVIEFDDKRLKGLGLDPE